MCYAIILAGGSGNRFNSDKPKQFVELEGKPILIHTLEKFQEDEIIKKIIVVSKHGYESETESLCKEFNITKLESYKRWKYTARIGFQWLVLFE